MSRCNLLLVVAALWLPGCTGPARAVRYLDSAELPDTWRTHAERTGYAETGRYTETVDFCRRLAEFSPYARYTNFGRSAEGRELPLLILSRHGAFAPGPQRHDTVCVLVQNCIHAGECDGKDASLELARDILVTGRRAELLAHVTLVIMPIFNTDGHERFGPYNRINQNGPREMGWRVTANNLNLNRDYMKADAPEMQHWLRCWTAWQPDLWFDNHVTDGSDVQYDLFYSTTTGPGLDPDISEWVGQGLLPHLLTQLAADGHLVLEYSYPRNEKDLAQGINAIVGYSPRYSTGYGAICNRPAFLVETHALKPYDVRVRTTYDVLVHTLEYVNAHWSKLRAAVCAADERCAAARGADADGGLPLVWGRGDEHEDITYRGMQGVLQKSEITGADLLQYTAAPQEVATRMYKHSRVTKSIVPPAAYLVPPQWTEALQRLEWHGITRRVLAEPVRLEVERYRLDNVKFAERSFEGRCQPRFETHAERAAVQFPAGTIVVPLDQPRARVVAHLLEPEAPDSLMGWGFFNAVLEQKEYAEDYRLEPIARQMLAQDAALRREFEAKLRDDPAFAADPAARLNFFYQRSPYWDELMNVYPVARVLDPATLAGLPCRPSGSGRRP